VQAVLVPLKIPPPNSAALIYRFLHDLRFPGHWMEIADRIYKAAAPHDQEWYDAARNSGTPVTVPLVAAIVITVKCTMQLVPVWVVALRAVALRG
jgi:hypothetical protein